MELKIDQVIYCHTTLIMENSKQEQAATKGKFYIINGISDYEIQIINDNGSYHSFDLDIESNSYYRKWFDDGVRYSRKKKINKLNNLK